MPTSFDAVHDETRPLALLSQARPARRPHVVPVASALAVVLVVLLFLV